MAIVDILENEKKKAKRIKFKPPVIPKTRGFGNQTRLWEHYSVLTFKYLVIFSLLSFLPSFPPFIFVLFLVYFFKCFILPFFFFFVYVACGILVPQ